jgi:hypothetical protein
MSGRSGLFKFALALVVAVMAAYSLSMLASNLWGLSGAALRTDALELAGLTAGLMLTSAIVSRRRDSDRE